MPHPVAGADQRWIDNHYGMVIARNARFGGEGGGLTFDALFERLDTLGAEADDERTEAILSAVYDYAESIAPGMD